jgi:hypothetical protein
MSTRVSAMHVSIVLAASLAGFVAYSGHRAAQLEQRVDALSKRLGAPAPQAGPAGASKPAATDAPNTAGYEQRLAALEAATHGLRDDLHTLEEATGNVPAPDLPQPNNNPQAILDVVSHEQNRIRDRMLEFHRARWMDYRKAALAKFAEAVQLRPDQTEELDHLLGIETDKLVEIMRRPETLEDPEQAAADWAEVLDETDRSALRVLDTMQRVPWTNGRSLERQTFWPWLPKTKSE